MINDKQKLINKVHHSDVKAANDIYKNILELKKCSPDEVKLDIMNVDSNNIPEWRIELDEYPEYYFDFKNSGIGGHVRPFPPAKKTDEPVIPLTKQPGSKNIDEQIRIKTAAWLDSINMKKSTMSEFIKFSRMYFDYVSEEEMNLEELNEFDRDWSSEEKKEVRMLLIAWNEGVQSDDNLSEEVKEEASQLNVAAQKELKKSNSVKDYLIRAGRSYKVISEKNYMKPFKKYIEDSGFRVNVNTVIAVTILGYTTGGINGAIIALLKYGKSKLLETENTKQK